MIYNSITDYIESKIKYLNTPGRIVDGHGFYFYGDSWISDKEYFAHNSRPVYEPFIRANPDGKNISPSVKVKRKYE